MKKVLLGAALGLVGGYCIRKMHEEKKFDKIIDGASDLAARTKKKFKDVTDMAQNEAEYVKDRAEYALEKGKAKFGRSADSAKIKAEMKAKTE